MRGAPIDDEGLDTDGIEQSVLDEILRYAEGKQGEDLKSRYAPAMEPDGDEAIPGVEASPDDGDGDEALDLTPEQIAQLEALLQGA